MREFFENLEGRTLFSSSIAVVTADYDQVVSDAKAIKADYLEAVLTYKADAKAISADIKALGKSKTNSADVAALSKADSAATSLDSKAASKVISVGQAALSRAKAAFEADVAHPTAKNADKLSDALTVLTTALAPYETTLDTDASSGDANVDTALSTLVSDNPSDTTLSTDAGTAEGNTSSTLANLSDQLTNTNADINTLAADIES